MIKKYNILDLPFIYSFSQFIFGPGADREISSIIGELLEILPKAKRLLDVGCGPSSWLFKHDLKPVGLDINPSYVKKYKKFNAEIYVGSSDTLPFVNQSFDGIWSIGLLHHLSDTQAKDSIREMMRVCKKGGYVVIIDAVLPDLSIKRIFPYLIRKLDRGKFVRNGAQNIQLFPHPRAWKIRRCTYTCTGLEQMIFVYRK